MKYKKILFFLLTFIFILTGSSVIVNADMGPKPSIHISIKGIEGQYVAAFAATKATGPNWFFKDHENLYTDYHPIMEYEDDEGFKWITFYKILNGDSEISFTYYRPEVFKLVIYQNDQLYKVTEKIDCYAYRSYYEIDFSNNIKIKNTYNYFEEIASLFFRITLTLGIEIGLFFLFRLFTVRNIIVIGITNIVTQIGLNIYLNIVSYFTGGLYAFLQLLFFEFIIFIIEPIIYIIFTREKKKWMVLLYGIAANVFSFIFGLIFWIS